LFIKPKIPHPKGIELSRFSSYSLNVLLSVGPKYN
jgi:hypothetical protein